MNLRRPRRVAIWTIGVLALAAVALHPELRPLAKQLLKPVGLIWVSLAAATIFAARRRCTAATTAAGLGFALLAGCGSPAAGVYLMRSLEAPYLERNPLEQGAFEAVIVLGGGVAAAPNGVAEASSSGDRVVLAARLWHAGRTGRLLLSGAEASPHAPEKNPAQLAKEILIDLGVPATSIVTLGGATTYGEAAAVAAYLRRNPSGRVGLITSARHLRRSERLFAAAGATVEPLPADYRTLIPPWRAMHLAPSIEGLNLFTLAINEWIQFASAVAGPDV